MSNVVRIKTVKAVGMPVTPRKPKRVTRAQVRRQAMVRYGAIVAGTGAAIITAISLSDVAQGLHMAGLDTVRAWALGVTVDTGMLACEALALANIGGRWAKGYVIGTLGASGVLNVAALTQGAPCAHVASAVIGLAMPAAIYALGQVMARALGHK